MDSYQNQKRLEIFMNAALELGILLRACSSRYVGLWEVRRIIFYEQADGLEYPDAEEREEAFETSEKLQIKEITIAGLLVTTLLEKKLVTLLQCREPDGEMADVTGDMEINAILRVDQNWIRKPTSQDRGYYLTITKEGEQVLRTNSLSLT